MEYQMKEPISFSKKIEELKNYKSEHMKSLRQELADAIRDGGDPEVLVKKYKEDVKNLHGIDEKIEDLQTKRAKIREVPLYSQTEEGQDEILEGDEVYEYLKSNNEQELLNALKTRTMTREQFLKLYYPGLFEMDIENKSALGEEKGKGEKADEPQKKKRVKIEKPSKTLSDLSVEYTNVDGVILPPKKGRPTRGMGSKKKLDNGENIVEYQNKILILLSKILTPENGFSSNDYDIIAGQEPKNMVRKTTYIVVEIPGENKEIILNNGYGEASFLCDEIFDKNLLTNTTKEALMEQYGDKILKLEFANEEEWINEILVWLGKNREAEPENLETEERPIDTVENAIEENINEPEEENVNVNAETDSEASEAIERRKATPKELFYSFEKYLEDFLETNNLQNASSDDIKILLEELRNPNEYMNFCEESKRKINDPECVFPSDLSKFIEEICPVKINEEQFIMILQSNRMQPKEFSDRVNSDAKPNLEKRETALFNLFWSIDFMKRDDIENHFKSQLWEAYKEKVDLEIYMNDRKFDRNSREAQEHYDKVNENIGKLEKKIIDTIYPYLKVYYTQRSFVSYKGIQNGGPKINLLQKLMEIYRMDTIPDNG